MVKLDRRFKQGNLVKQMPSEKLDYRFLLKAFFGKFFASPGFGFSKKSSTIPVLEAGGGKTGRQSACAEANTRGVGHRAKGIS